MKTILTVLVMTLLATPTVRAQLVNDGATRTLSNVTNNLTGSVIVGTNGSFTLLVLSNNCLLTNSGVGTIGANATAKSNELRLLSSTARWRMGGTLFVGSGGNANTLVVGNGALVDSVNGTIGSALSASNNLAILTGAGSTWTNSGVLRIGDIGPGNRLIVSNGGSVSVGGIAYVGLNSQSTSNRVTVDSGTLRVTNDTASGLLDVRRGTLTLNSGLVEVDQLLATNAAGFLEFNGGALALRNSTVNSLRVGNGTNAATLLLTGNGTNTVSGACIISSNAVLAGNGQLVGALTVQLGGTISPGASIGKIDLSVTPTLQGSIHMEISKNGATLAEDQIEMVGAVRSFNYGGTLTVTKVGPTALAAGDTFQLFRGDSYNGVFASITLPTLGAGLGWENRMNGDGSIAVANGAPGVATFFPTTITGTSATLLGTAWPHGFNTVGWFEWGAAPVGEVPPLANMTPVRPLGGGISPTNLSETLTGLSGNAFVMFRAAASNSFGVSYGNIEFFVTRGPGVRTSPATGLAVSTATLNGAAFPGGTATTSWFQWGTTTNYGNATPPQSVGSGTGSINVSNSVSGLTPGLTIHYRCVASNSLAVSFGSDVSFAIAFSPAGVALPGVQFSSVAWGDYNNDGRLDILLTGNTNSSSNISQVWRNTGGGFVDANAGVAGVAQGSGAWGDFDNDGRLDVVVTGDATGTGDGGISQIWRNTGTGFTNINAGLPGLSVSAAAWGDYDGDGRLDLLLAGIPSVGPAPITQLWRNTGAGFDQVIQNLPGLGYGSVAWGDYDNDGRLDAALCGTDGTNLIAQVWRNTGTGFSNINVGLPGVEYASVAWGDYDNDGRLDILLTGNLDFSGDNAISQVWHNIGTGFININAGLPGVYAGGAAWGDYDNDGRLDIALTGRAGTNTITQVWRNTSTGFVNSGEVLPGLLFGSVVWGDFDNDGRLDLLLAGQNGNSRIAQVWHNDTPQANTPPAAPTGLSVTLSNNAVAFHWNPSTDAQTPANGLTHNLRVGTTPGGGELIPPMAASNGVRRLPAPGNVQHNAARFLTGLPAGQPIYWSVQAVDTEFAGGAFAPEQSFTFNTVFTPPSGVPVPGDTNGDGVVDDAEFAATLAHLHGNGVVSELNLDQVLSNYFPNSPFLQMTKVAGLGGTNVTFALTNDLAGAFSVEFTTNFANWFFLGPAAPRYEFTDTNVPAVPQRYYRLRWP